MKVKYVYLSAEGDLIIVDTTLFRIEVNLEITEGVAYFLVH